MSNEATGRIDLILYSKTDEMPVVHMLSGEKAEQMSFLKMRSFWILEVNNLPTDVCSLELSISPSLGASYTIPLFFKEQQPFMFYADLRPGEFVPFDEFMIFFSLAISSGKLSFSFDSERYRDKPIEAVRQFLTAFEDEYVLWALAFVASQPWISLFRYNDELSALLFEIVKNLVSKFFFEPETVPRGADVFSFEHTFGDVMNCRSKVSVSEKTESARLFAETLFAVTRCQIGDAFTYLLSVLYDADGDFPIMLSLAPFRESLKQKEAEELLSSLILDFAGLEDDIRLAAYTKIFYTVLAIANTETSIDLSSVIDIVRGKINPDFVCEILTRRLCLTDPNSGCPMEYLVGLIRDVSALDAVIRNFECTQLAIAIPAEWVQRFALAAKITDTTDLLINSVVSGIPSHYKSAFAQCSIDGALILTENVNPKAVLQPGAIVQHGSILHDDSMLMTNSIIVDGAELQSNCYASANAVVVDSSTRMIHENAIIAVPMQFKRGISIGDGAVISKHCLIGSGSIVSKGAFLGPGTHIDSGCIVLEDQIVFGDIDIPPGFVFSNETVEFTSKIPQGIFREGFGFKRLRSGFFNLYLLMTSSNASVEKVLNAYLGQMTAYPLHLGYELADCPAFFDHMEDFVWEMHTLYGIRALFIAIGFWEAEGLDQPGNIAIRTLATKALTESSVSSEDLVDGMTLWSLRRICDSFPLLVSKSVPETAVESFKKRVCRACDTLMIQLTVMKYPNDARFMRSIREIVEICSKPV